MPPPGENYSIIDYYTHANWTGPEYEWIGPLGRALPAVECGEPFKTALGKVGIFRVLLLVYHAVLPPLFFLIGRSPPLPADALHGAHAQANQKLQRTAAKRKAEVRRMTEGGQEFAVKRAAKSTGQAGEKAGRPAAAQVHRRPQLRLRLRGRPRGRAGHRARRRDLHAARRDRYRRACHGAGALLEQVVPEPRTAAPPLRSSSGR